MLVESCDAATCTTNCMLRAHMQGQLVPLIFPAWACKCQVVLAKALPILHAAYVYAGSPSTSP